MRLDVFLKKALLLKQRTAAQKICKGGLVKINYQPAKPAKEVQEGDIVELSLPHRFLTVRVEEIPKGNVSKEKAKTLYSIMNDEKRDPFQIE